LAALEVLICERWCILVFYAVFGEMG
jgi:hypothetical protein